LAAANKNSTREITYSGILLAILMIVLYIYTISPTNKLIILMFASFIIGVELSETSIKYTIIFYFASLLLTLIFPINKISLLLYYSFFGIYGLIKYYIEKIEIIILEYIVKTIFFITIFLLNITYIKLLLPKLVVQFPVYILLLLSFIAFLLYDYLYTLIVQLYTQKIRRGRN